MGNIVTVQSTVKYFDPRETTKKACVYILQIKCHELIKIKLNIVATCQQSLVECNNVYIFYLGCKHLTSVLFTVMTI